MSTSIAARAVSKALLIALALLAACGDSNPIVEPPPPVAVATVAVSPPNQSLIVGSQLTLEATPKSANGQELDRAVTWTSANEQYATVSATGVVTALAVGEVSIRATSEGKFGLAVITILPVPQVPVTDVRLSVDEEIVLEWDGVASITARAYDAEGNELVDRHIQWSSNRPSIAAVVNGTIEAQNPGTATITATVEGIVASVGVRVNQAPIVSISIAAATTGLEVGESFVFAAPVERANGETTYGPADWTSSTPGVARVEHTDVMYAVVEALSEGTFTLSASVEGKTASLTLTVTAKPTYDLIYNRWKDGGSEIFTLSTLNTSEVPVKINAGNVSREASPSPDGTQLVFAVSQTNPTTGEPQNDLYIVNRNGMNMRWLTRMSGLEDQPQWSPDGTKILFHAIVDSKIDLYTINPDGSGLTNLTSFIGAEMVDKRQPTWSRNGLFIAFIGAIGGSYKVFMIDANGSNLRQITTDAGFDMSPTFSPDGQKIAFVRHNTAAPALGDDIMIVNVNGGLTVRHALAGDQRTPSWSPDGTFIAVSGTQVAGTGISQIYTMRVDGSGLRLRTVNPAHGGGVAPAWIARP
ncbi:MAG: Ig-like domain-containing protein [Gemmatimonadaceae bacterium]